jgi:hypothetical protein
MKGHTLFICLLLSLLGCKKKDDIEPRADNLVYCVISKQSAGDDLFIEEVSSQLYTSTWSLTARQNFGVQGYRDLTITLVLDSTMQLHPGSYILKTDDVPGQGKATITGHESDGEPSPSYATGVLPFGSDVNATGVLTIDNVENRKVSGSFSFKAVVGWCGGGPPCTAGESVIVKDGVFEDVPY